VRLYPDLPGRRAATLWRDVCVAVLLACFALIGLAVHDTVDRLAALGAGVRESGAVVNRGFERAAEAVEGAPVVGDDVAGGLRAAGEGTGGEVEELGASGESAAHDLAKLLGVVVFALPAGVLLAWYVPPRVRQIRRLTQAALVLATDSPERRRVVAMRAAFSLPYGDLLRHTQDPLGDLAAERYDDLVAAALDSEGLRPRSSPA
jgi:hypothetical protein